MVSANVTNDTYAGYKKQTGQGQAERLAGRVGQNRQRWDLQTLTYSDSHSQSHSHSQNITALLEGVASGRVDSWQRLLSSVYQELRVIAHAALRSEAPGRTLQTTDLVHEAYIRLVDDKQCSWQNRRHFFHAAARAVRQILVDKARERKAAKRGAGRRPLSLEAIELPRVPIDDTGDKPLDLEELDRALNKLNGQDEHKRKCSIVELRYFVGLTLEQTARIVGVSLSTVVRDWEFARAWLYREMQRSE